MRWMSELGHQHGRSRVLETESQANDGTSHGEHGQSICECLQEDAENDDHRADDDGIFPANLLDKPPQEELREDSTKALGTVEDA